MISQKSWSIPLRNNLDSVELAEISHMTIDLLSVFSVLHRQLYWRATSKISSSRNKFRLAPTTLLKGDLKYILSLFYNSVAGWFEDYIINNLLSKCDAPSLRSPPERRLHGMNKVCLSMKAFPSNHETQVILLLVVRRWLYSIIWYSRKLYPHQVYWTGNCAVLWEAQTH
jgi:hypothetical protein